MKLGVFYEIEILIDEYKRGELNIIKDNHEYLLGNQNSLPLNSSVENMRQLQKKNTIVKSAKSNLKKSDIKLPGWRSKRLVFRNENEKNNNNNSNSTLGTSLYLENKAKVSVRRSGKRGTISSVSHILRAQNNVNVGKFDLKEFKKCLADPIIREEDGEAFQIDENMEEFIYLKVNKMKFN